LFLEVNVNFCIIIQLTELNVQHFYSLFGSKLGFGRILDLLYGLVVFTRSAITLPKLNRFGWNLEHSE